MVGKAGVLFFKEATAQTDVGLDSVKGIVA